QTPGTEEAEELEFERWLNELEEYPKGFEDQILNTLIRRPVLLPSGNVTDYNCIFQNICNYGKDPFNNNPLYIDQLEPLPELEKQINDWIEQKRVEWKALRK
ncbi:MAG: hypothetical protein EZS28_006980, partial [Streblomastix strix]